VEDGWPARLRTDGKALWEDHGAGWRRRDLASGRVRGQSAPPDAPAVAVSDFWATTDAIVHDKDGEPGVVVETSAFVDDLAVAGEMAAFTLDRDDGQVYGFDLGSARLRWVLRPRERVPGFEAGDGSRVEILGARLLVYAPPGLMSVDPASGAIAWIARVPALVGRWGPLRAVEIVGAERTQWVVSVDGAVVALDAATGDVDWSVEAGAGGATSLLRGGASVCFDWRDQAVEPYRLDEAEVARDLAVVIAGGVVSEARWVKRADVPADAERVPLLELPRADGAPALRLELGGIDALVTRDASRLLTGVDRTVYVEVPGAWETAALIDQSAVRLDVSISAL
jgi:hypothetical protein